MKLKLVGVCLQLARDLSTEVVGANSNKGRVDESSIGGSDGVRSGNSIGKGSSVGEDLRFSISITLAIVSVSVWVSVGSVSIGIRSGISIVSIESISISLWFSISITLAIVSVDSSVVGEGDSLGHSVKSLGDGVKTSAGAKGDNRSNTSNQNLGISLSVSLAVVSSSARDGDIGGVDARGGLETDDGVGGIGVSSITQILSRDSSQQGGSKCQEFHCD